LTPIQKDVLLILIIWCHHVLLLLLLLVPVSVLDVMADCWSLPPPHIRLYCPFPSIPRTFFFIIPFFHFRPFVSSSHSGHELFLYWFHSLPPPPRRDLCDAKSPRNPELFRPKQIFKNKLIVPPFFF
jgi:hypothetical protein